MLIKIQGLPFKTKYQDVKLLVRSECTITDFKLDNLVVDSDGTKKVLVTVGNEAEAFCLIKCLNGYRMSNCVLGVEAISTPKAAEVHQPQNTYEQRPGQKYPPQTRNDYPNQMANDYNRGPPNYGQSSHNVGPQRPVEPMGGRNEGWNSGTPSSNQWSHNPTNNPQGSQNTGFPGTPIYPQHPSVPQRMNNSSYAANRPQQSPNYGYTPKSNMPDSGNTHSRQDMRNIEAPSTHNAAAGSRYPASFHQDKPITIMKDNFQGPTMYQMGSNPGSYPGATRGTPAIWNQGQEPKSQGYPKSNPLPYEKYDDDRRHSQLDKRSDGKIPQDGVRVAVYKDYEKSRQFSPGRRVATRNTSPSMKKRGPSPPASSHREMLARRLASPERKISPMGAAMSGRISPPIRNMSPPGRRVSPSGRWVSARPTSPHGRRPSPSGRRPSPSGRRPSPSGRRPSPSARRPSPSGRRPSPMGGRVLTPRMASPSGRRMSPSGRRVSPGRRPQSLERRPGSGRRMSPQRAGRHVSPPGRRGSPSERRMSPGDRRMLDRRESPRRLAAQKRGSPGRRLDSPPPGSGAGARQVSRYSPRRHHDDKIVDPKMDMDVAKGKQVRPAYESQASSQAMYSGGYRQSLKENVGYPMSGARQPEQRMSPWHQERDKNTYPPMKKEDDRRDINEKRHSRQSRSPVHRDRSPIRDHYRTNSPVSRSPRRSWALEKRPYGRSPEATEAPPPPIWPGKNSREDDTYKNKFSSHEDVPKHPTVWERPPMKLEDPKRDESRRSGEDKARGRGAFDPNQREPKFNPRHDFEDGRKEEYQRQRDMARRSAERRDYREGHPKMHEESRYDDYRRLRSPGREEPKKPEFHKEFDKDFEDIYKRAQEFRKKAEQLRRSGDSRRDDHDDERREPHREEKYDRRRDNSPHRHADMDRHEREPDRRYEDPKYKERDPRDREPEWKLVDKMKKYPLMPHVKAKREKAADELLEKIMHKYKQIADLNEDQKKRVAEELKLGLSRMFTDMFGDTDVSFIEIVIKYQAKVSAKQEEAMVREVLECLPSMFRRGKRSAPEPEGSSKMARYSPQSAMKEERRPRWSPAKEEVQWDLRGGPNDPREMDRHKYDKFDHHPKEQRPKFIHKREDDKPMRNPTAPKPKYESGSKLKYEAPPKLKYESAPKLKYETAPRSKYETAQKIVYESGPKLKYDALPKQKYEAPPKPKYDHPTTSVPNMKPKEEVKPKPITPVKPKVKVVPKVSPKSAENKEQQQKNVEAKQGAVEETPMEDTIDASAPGGYYELSPLMARMLDMELQDIMIKVWQELPDNPLTDAEKLVVNKLRNEAGDDLRNAFGLSASQRLLNVYNVMYIKMIFTANPDGQELALFLVKNGISNFKWNNVKPLCFVAVVQNVNDFDRLCATQNYTIGNVKVTIAPLYQFTKCPQRLRTSYNISSTKSAHSGTFKVEASKQSDQPSVVAEAKLAEGTNANEETKTDNKPVPTKIVEKPTNIKESAKAETIAVKNTAKVETVKEKPKETVKPPTNVNATKNAGKQIIKKEEKKPDTKKEPVKKAVSKKPKALCTNLLQDGNDYDELNDDEIMALVSQGIILDECSGSDID
ncbi:serine/arginine repetitive matrix protein 2 isoform X4 [Manduca sexta]|uniref:serine/arginine repetitive matrix protein 2 isoform X4 n=1 Tax=Manduca sexta TaxID=7130 RepID=UPI00188FD19D|nr:serine/arginine repetitive matrix protein 2 isoform X4 [Manduca sexta]